jgi:gluconolactonase
MKQRLPLNEIARGWQRADIESASFVVHDQRFEDILGESPELIVEYELKWPFAHEAGVHFPQEDAVYITSNQIKADHGDGKSIVISRMQRALDGRWTHTQIDTNVRMANGGCEYRGGVLFCDQGNHSRRGGLVLMETRPPYTSRVLIDSFHGRRFNSPNDVVVHSDGSIWFTDPIYGFEQGICPKPELPNQVYRFEPESGGIRVLADGFQRPNGLAFSPDESTLYVTDTAWIHGDGTTDDTRPSTMCVLFVKLILAMLTLLQIRS